MNSPIQLNRAASRPSRATPPARRGRPLMAVAGVAALLTATVAMWQEIEPLVTFRPAHATIVSADVARARARPAGGIRGFRPSRQSQTGSVADLNYRYAVDGRERFGSTYRRTGMIESRREVASRIAGLVPGQGVTAWYNPWLPEDAVLERTPHPVWLMVLAAVALLGVALVLISSPSRTAESAGSGAAHEPAPLAKSA